MLRTACRDAVDLRDKGYPLHLSVNLSMQQFRDPDLVGRIAGILDETGLGPEWLELELTETIIMTEATQSIAALNQMIFRGWFGLDEIYAAHPTLTLAIAALLSVVPLGVTMNYYLDDP